MPSEGMEYEHFTGEDRLTPEEEARIERNIEFQIQADVDAWRDSRSWWTKTDEIMRDINRSIRACGAETYEALKLAMTDWQLGRITRRELEAAIALWQRSEYETG